MQVVVARSSQKIEDPKFWEDMLVFNGLPRMDQPTDRRRRGLRPGGESSESDIIGCPLGKKHCVFAGGSCENGDACSMIAPTHRSRRYGV